MRTYTPYMRCPKCGAMAPNLKWTGGLVMVQAYGARVETHQMLGVLIAECSRCGYEEEILPLDAGGAVPDEQKSGGDLCQ